MKVIIIHNYYQHPAGEQVVFKAEKSLLRKHGHQMKTFIKSNKDIRKKGACSTIVQALWSNETRGELSKILRVFKPDIAHFHNIFFLISPSAYYTCQEYNIPVVQTLHNYRLLCPNAIFYQNGRICERCLQKSFSWPGILQGCYHNSRSHSLGVALIQSVHQLLNTWQDKVDAYIVLTDFARSKFIEGGLPEEKLFVKPNFLFEDLGVSHKLGDSALFAGRLAKEKGIFTLLRAWRQLEDVPLKIAGSGPLRAQVKHQINQYSLTAVDQLGHQHHDKVFKLMKGARFLIFPSEWYEGFPITLIEAFSCGLPVISSDLGAMSSIISHKINGLLFPAGNAKALADKVQWAWSHPNKMRKMGENARFIFEEKYTAKKNYKMLMGIYEKAIQIHKRNK